MNLERPVLLVADDDPAIHDALGRLIRRLAPIVLRAAAERLRKPLVGLTAEAERLLATAAWEGYARELRTVIERACVLAEGEFITEKELHGAMPPGAAAARATAASSAGQTAPAAGGDRGKDLLTTVEREHIQRALQRAGGNKKLAAQILGVSRRALYRRLERLQLGDTITRRPSNPIEPIGT